MSGALGWSRGPRAWLPAAALIGLASAALPAVLSPGGVGDATLAVTRGAEAAGAAVALAVARPSLALAGLGGVAAYTSGDAALHGWPVPLAMLAGIALATLVSVALGFIGARLAAGAYLALTFVAVLAGGALVAALPEQLGGAVGLQGVPALQVPLPGKATLVFGTDGVFHVTLALVTVAVIACGALLLALPGARWRAIGGDRERSAGAGLRPLRGTLAALAVSGALAGLGGALAVHATGVATPSAFSADAAVVPLLVALLAGRAGPPAAAMVGAAVAALGLRALPALGWTGPPGAEALTTGVLAALTLAALPALLRRGRPGLAVAGLRAWWPARRGSGPAGGAPGHALRDPDGAPSGSLPPLDAPWPSMSPAGGSSSLVVRGLDVVPERGAASLAVLDMAVEAGGIHGLVGANGAGKSTALRAIATAAGRGRAVSLPEGSPSARVILLPQAGGGWPGCTVEETLRLAARASGRPTPDARSEAAAWRTRLGLDDVSNALCESLSHGARRRLELARTLLLRPAVLLCDEPLAGLGDADRALVLACLRAAAADGVTLVVAEHDRASLARLATTTTELRRADANVADTAPGAAPA